LSRCGRRGLPRMRLVVRLARAGALPAVALARAAWVRRAVGARLAQPGRLHLVGEAYLALARAGWVRLAVAAYLVLAPPGRALPVLGTGLAVGRLERLRPLRGHLRPPNPRPRLPRRLPG
jgi:hypothetical protein